MSRARSQESKRARRTGHLSVINVPLVAHSARAVPRTNMLEMVPNRTSLLGVAVSAPAGACGKLGNGVLLVLPVGPGAGLGEKTLEGVEYATLPNKFTSSRSATTIGSMCQGGEVGLAW